MGIRKAVLAGVMAVALCIGLIGCGSNESGTTASNDTSTTTSKSENAKNAEANSDALSAAKAEYETVKGNASTMVSENSASHAYAMDSIDTLTNSISTCQGSLGATADVDDYKNATAKIQAAVDALEPLDQSTTVQDIYAAAQKNPLTAKDTYVGNHYLVTGTIDEMKEGFLSDFGDIHIIIVAEANDGTTLLIKADFNNDCRSQLSNYAIGDSITFEGKCEDDEGLDWEACRFW